MNAETLKQKRDRLGWTQAELGKQIDVSRLTILNYENKKIQIPKMAEMALEKVFSDNGA